MQVFNTAMLKRSCSEVDQKELSIVVFDFLLLTYDFFDIMVQRFL